MADAMRASNGTARGVATVGEDITEAELKDLHEAGTRGVRFNFVRRLADFTPFDVLMRTAKKIAPLGWHIVVYFEAADLPELAPFFSQLPTRVIVDHMGTPNISLGVDHPQFAAFERLMENEKFWCKATCPERLSLQGPPYDDVEPFCARLVEHFPDRVLWGTDWPHPNMRKWMPDDGKAVDYIPRIAPRADQQQKLLVDNPMRLYWADQVC